MSAFELDPDYPDRIMGWAVFRVDPWDFAGFFVDSAEARKKRDELGYPYLVRHGTKGIGTDDFQWYRTDESDG